MQTSARVESEPSGHRVSVATTGDGQSLRVPAKPVSPGSGVNGGELPMLALATCRCDDITREAARLKFSVDAVTVEAVAGFESIGVAATHIRYNAHVSSSASESEVSALLQETDAVAGVHNPDRKGAHVRRVPWPHIEG